MTPRDRIPIPSAQRWHDFRIQGVPVLVFSVCILAVVHLWRTHVGSATLVGEAEAVRTQVSSPQAGTLSELRVARFQVVAAGDPVAVILPADSRVQIALLEAEVDLMRLRVDPNLSAQRNAMDYEGLRLEWLQQKVELSSARVALQRAENDRQRNLQLFEMNILSADLFDASEKARDQIRTEVDERAALVADVETAIRRLEPLRAAEQVDRDAQEELEAGFNRIESRLQRAERLLEPVVLTATRGGMITAVHSQPGEQVLGGVPLLTIAMQQPERIVGYLRQPLALEPAPGMRVLVTTRATRRRAGEAVIQHVGFQFEPITNTLAALSPVNVIDLGLPIEVSLPPSLALRPGEHVDLTILAR